MEARILSYKNLVLDPQAKRQDLMYIEPMYSINGILGWYVQHNNLCGFYSDEDGKPGKLMAEWDWK